MIAKSNLNTFYFEDYIALMRSLYLCNPVSANNLNNHLRLFDGFEQHIKNMSNKFSSCSLIYVHI